MLHLNKITAALALGTALLASGQMATAATLHATPYAHASHWSVGHKRITMPGLSGHEKFTLMPASKPNIRKVSKNDVPGLSEHEKFTLMPTVKPVSAPADKAADVRPALKHQTKYDLPTDLFALGEEGFETVEFFTDFFYASRALEVTRAGTYELTLTDMVFPESLRKLGATVTTAQDKLTELFGSGSILFDMDIGTHYLSYFAKAQMEYDLGLFGLTLRYYDGATTPVPVPGALWLLGSGLIGLAGITRGRKLR
jgi:hypothetical protein